MTLARSGGLSGDAWRVERVHLQLCSVVCRTDGHSDRSRVIFGESEGGPMSILFAATYPERTIGLVLFGSIVRWVDETFDGAFRPQGFAELIDAFAQGWGRLASRTVKDLVAGSGISFRELGDYTLKGVPDTWQVYEAFAH